MIKAKSQVSKLFDNKVWKNINMSGYSKILAVNNNDKENILH